MNKFRLPLHKRYIIHKWVGIAVHRKVWMIAAGIVLGLLIAAGEEYMLEHNLRLVRENEVRDLLAWIMKPPLGAPGTTGTDWREGTHDLHVGGWKK